MAFFGIPATPPRQGLLPLFPLANQPSDLFLLAQQPNTLSFQPFGTFGDVCNPLGRVGASSRLGRTGLAKALARVVEQFYLRINDSNDNFAVDVLDRLIGDGESGIT